MRRELSKSEVERLFIGAVDEALPPGDLAVFCAELEHDAELKRRYELYRSTVKRVQGTAKEKAPDALASMILRRTRRRRFQLRNNDFFQHWHVPAEVVIPLLLAALVALFMLIGSP